MRPHKLFASAPGGEAGGCDARRAGFGGLGVEGAGGPGGACDARRHLAVVLPARACYHVGQAPVVVSIIHAARVWDLTF